MYSCHSIESKVKSTVCLTVGSLGLWIVLWTFVVSYGTELISVASLGMSLLSFTQQETEEKTTSEFWCSSFSIIPTSHCTASPCSSNFYLTNFINSRPTSWSTFHKTKIQSFFNVFMTKWIDSLLIFTRSPFGQKCTQHHCQQNVFREGNFMSLCFIAKESHCTVINSYVSDWLEI